MGTSCCTAPSLEGRRLSQDFVIRNEFKYDLFDNDLSDIISTIERDHDEIKRPTPATLTLYFYDTVRGAPEVDPFFRLRTYAHFDANSTSLDDIKALPSPTSPRPCCGSLRPPVGCSSQSRFASR